MKAFHRGSQEIGSDVRVRRVSKGSSAGPTNSWPSNRGYTLPTLNHARRSTDLETHLHHRCGYGSRDERHAANNLAVLAAGVSELHWQRQAVGRLQASAGKNARSSGFAKAEKTASHHRIIAVRDSMRQCQHKDISF